MQLSIIIPFKERDGDPDCIRRLDNAIQCFADHSDIEVVVYDTGTKPASDFGFSAAEQKNLSYFHHPEPGVFAPGRVRNRAIAKARGRFIFLFDADLLVSQNLVEKLNNHIQELENEGSRAFRMFPCLYLSKGYSQPFSEHFANQRLQQNLYRKVLSSYLQGQLAKIDGIALASSCLLIRKDWFMALGGFRDCFAGHGCEDFDLIHRLAAFYPIGIKPSDYTTDVKCQFPACYQGFRRYYSFYALPHLFEQQFLLHQWHPRPLTKTYHRRREVNESLFADILASDTLDLPAPLQVENQQSLLEKDTNCLPFHYEEKLPDFQPWIRQLQAQYGFPVETYPGLFRFAEGVKKPSGGFKRKLRKLYLNPVQFFKDIKWH